MTRQRVCGSEPKLLSQPSTSTSTILEPLLPQFPALTISKSQLPEFPHRSSEKPRSSSHSLQHGLYGSFQACRSTSDAAGPPHALVPQRRHRRAGPRPPHHRRGGLCPTRQRQLSAQDRASPASASQPVRCGTLIPRIQFHMKAGEAFQEGSTKPRLRFRWLADSFPDQLGGRDGRPVQELSPVGGWPARRLRPAGPGPRALGVGDGYVGTGLRAARSAALTVL